MKTQLVFFSIMISIITTKIQAQQRTIVNATNSEISDNLDLRAISSVFGDSNNLQDFVCPLVYPLNAKNPDACKP